MTERFVSSSRLVSGSAVVPDGWRWARLGDVVELLPARSIATQGDTEVDAITTACLTETGFDRRGLRRGRMWADDARAAVVSGGEVLVARSNTPELVGRAAMVPADCAGVVATDLTIRLRSKGNVTPGFVSLVLSCLYVSGYWRTEAGGASGSMKKITRSQVEALLVPVAPEAEQVRLVEMMTEAFAAVERARAAAEARLEATDALPSAALQAIFDQSPRKRWPEVPLGAILSLRKDVIHPHDMRRGRATFVGLEHIESGTGRRTGSEEVELSNLTGRKPMFAEGEIVYGYLRPYLNKVWIAEFDGLCSVDQYVFRIDRTQASPQFIAAFMRSPAYLRRAPITTTPGQLPRIRTDEVASVSIALPPIREQRRLLAAMTTAADTTARLHRAAQAELEAIHAVPSALLRRAFMRAVSQGQGCYRRWP